MTLPRITLVTPSFNQGRFLDAAIRSVLDQRYPDLEYFVMDGGSTDDSVDVIHRYADRLAGWVSQPDGGQYAAIADGFARSTGEVMGWLNSDDLHLPWTLHTVGQIFADLPQVDWISTLFPMTTEAEGHPLYCQPMEGFHREAFMRGEFVGKRPWHTQGWIMQEGTFWRRSLWERAGGFLQADTIAGDFELWTRYYRFAPLYGVAVPLATFRLHPGQKTALHENRYHDEALRIFQAAGGRPHGAWQSYMRRRWGAFLPARMAFRLRLRTTHPKIFYNMADQKWHPVS